MFPNLQNISSEINRRITDAVSGLLNLGQRTSVPNPLPNRPLSVPASIKGAKTQAKASIPQPQPQLRFPRAVPKAQASTQQAQRPALQQPQQPIQQRIQSAQQAGGMTPQQIQQNPLGQSRFGGKSILPSLSAAAVPGSLRSLQAGARGEASIRPLLLKFNDAYGSNNVKTVIKSALDILKQPAGSGYDDYKMNTVRMVLRKFPEAVSAFSKYTSGL